MFYNANLYKVGLMNSQRHGGQRSTSVTFSTPEIPGAAADTLRCARNHSHLRTAGGVVCVTFACQIWTHCVGEQLVHKNVNLLTYEERCSCPPM